MAYIGNQPLATAVTNADISSSAAIDLSKLATTGDLSATNVTLGGYLRGPSTFTIDPAAHGDNTGTLVIAGNLQVDGLTTTVNSTTMTVDDKNITVASGAANAAAADGAGITVDGASATLLYNATPDAWSFNKKLGIGSYVGSSINAPLNIKSDTNHHGLSIEENNGTETWQVGVDVDGDLNFHNSGNAIPSVTFDDSGNVGIGGSTVTDANLLNIQGSGASSNIGVVFNDTNTSKIYGIQNGGSDLKFFDYTANAERFRISSGGVVQVNGSGYSGGKFGVLAGAVNSEIASFSGSAHGGGLKIKTASTTRNDDTVIFNASDAFGEIAFHSDNTEVMRITKDNRLDLAKGIVDTTTTVSYASSIALTLDNGAIQTVTLTGNATFTDSLNDGEAIVLMLNGGASHTVTWTAVTKWVTGSGNAAPTLTASDAIILWKIGSSVYAATAGSFA